MKTFLPIPDRPTLKNIQHTNANASSTENKRFEEGAARFKNDPIGFAHWLGYKLLTEEQEKILLSVRDRHVTNVQAAHGVGKCLGENEPVLLASGLEVPANRLVGRNFKLLTLVNGSVTIATAKAEWNMTEKVFEITTESGRKIIRNGKHPLFAAIKWSRDGAHPLLDVKEWSSVERMRYWMDHPPDFPRPQFVPKDWSFKCKKHAVLCAVPDEVPVFGDQPLSECEVKILAYLIGDGGMTAESIIFTQENNKQLCEFNECVKTFDCVLSSAGNYGYRVVDKFNVSKEKKTEICLDSVPRSRNGRRLNQVKLMLQKHGLMYKGSVDKVIPDAIFQLPKEQLVIFLSRLFSTDGWACVSKPAKNRKQGSLEIGFCSVSEQLVIQVQKLLLRFGILANVRKKSKVNAWMLEIHAAPMIIKFCNEIGIFGKEDAILSVLEKAKARNINRIHKWRKNKAPEGTIWERVVSICELPPQKTVAIEVPIHHTYLTNFYEHNSFLAGSICLLWWVFACQGLCITTAPTKRQVEEILWREARTSYDRNCLKLGGERGKTFVRISADAYAFGFTAKSNDSNGFQGVHHDRLLVIIDEANGISQEINDGAISCATGAYNRILRIGNPTESGTPFEKDCKLNHIRIPVWNHPNVSWAYELHESGWHRLKPEVAKEILQDDPEQPVKAEKEWSQNFPRDVIPGAVSIGWIETQRIKKGEGSAFWLGRVEGIFPQDNSASIIPISYFKAARARYDLNPELWEERANRKRYRYGLDVGDGGDPSALSTWQAGLLRAIRKKETTGDGLDTDRAAGLATNAAKDNPGVIAVDRIGVGAGSLAIILTNKYKGVGVNWGESADKKDDYLNLKAEDFWILREDMRKGEVAIAPLGELEDELMEDLAGVHYEETSNEKIRIEDKKKTRERLGRSPNLGDAVVLGYRKRKAASLLGS